MFVKICGITNEDDALFAVAMGADAVGFVFAPSPRQVAAQTVYDITRRLPPEVLTVGVFRDEHPSRVIDLANKANVKAVQLHGRETKEQTIEIGKSVRWVIKAFGADSPHLPEADQYGTDLVLLDAPSPGSGKVFDWRLASEVPDGVRLILAGGLDPTTWPTRSRSSSRGASTSRRASRRHRAGRTRPRSDASSPTHVLPHPPRTSARTNCPTTGPTNEDSMTDTPRHPDRTRRRDRPLR